MRWLLGKLCPIIGLLILAATTATAQYVGYNNTVWDSNARPVPNASIRVCTYPASGANCTPLATVYSSPTGGSQSNPFQADSYGNYSFFASPGTYVLQISGPGVTQTTIPYVLLPGPGSTLSYQAVPFSATPTFNAALYTTFFMTLTGNVTGPTVTNAVPNEYLTFNLCQDSTGSRTFAWPASFVNAPTINPTASSCTGVHVYYDGTNWKQITTGINGGVLSGTTTNIGAMVGGAVNPKSLSNVQYAGQFSTFGAAVSAACNGTAPGKVVLPPGVTTSAAVALPANCTIVGSAPFGGSVLQSSNGVNADFLTASSASNIMLKNLTVDGNETNQTAGSCVAMTSVIGLFITNVTVQNCYAHGIEVVGTSSDVLIAHSDVSNAAHGSGVILGNTPPNAKVTDFRIIGNHITNAPAADGIFVIGSLISGQFGTGNGVIADNVIDDIGDTSIEVGQATQDVAVTGNQVSIPNTTGTTGIMVRSAKDITVTGNEVVGAGASSQDCFFVWNGSPDATSASNIDIAGNIARGCGAYGFYTNSGDDILLSSNKAQGNGTNYDLGAATNVREFGNDNNLWSGPSALTFDATNGDPIIQSNSGAGLWTQNTGTSCNAGGLWRQVISGGNLLLNANTAAGCDFSSSNTALELAYNGSATVGNTLTVNGNLAIGGGSSITNSSNIIQNGGTNLTSGYIPEATGSAVVGNSAWQDTGTVSTYGGNYIKVGSASNVFYAGATDSTSAACTFGSSGVAALCLSDGSGYLDIRINSSKGHRAEMAANDGGVLTNNLATALKWTSGNNIIFNGSNSIGWVSGDPGNALASDTGLSRDSAGVIDVGNGTAGDKSGTIQGSNLVFTGLSSSTSALNYVCYNSSTGAFTYDSSGTCLASLRQYKNIDGAISPRQGLDEVMALKPDWYSYKAGLGINDTTEHGGFIAQDVQAVDPRLASYVNGKLHGVRTLDSVPAVTVAAIQELQREVTELQKELAAIKEKRQPVKVITVPDEWQWHN